MSYPVGPRLGMLALAAALLPQSRAAGDAADTADLEALLNQPVYAASKFAQDAAGAPAAATVLTAGDIRAYGWRTLAEVLEGVRGVYFRYDRFYNYVGVRGLARPGDFSSRLLVLIDGVRVNDNIYGQAGVGREFPLDVGLIERVEFIPGPGSALYGSNAVLGVVNIVTRSDAALLGQAVTTEIGSGSSRVVSVTSGQAFGRAHLALAARAEQRPGATLQFPTQELPSAEGADRETDRKLYAKWSLAEVTATALFSRRRKHIPTGAFDTTYPSASTYGSDEYAIGDVQWQHRIDAARMVFLRAGLAQYRFEGRFDYALPDGRQHLDQTGRWGTVEAQWHYSGWQGHRMVLGFEGQDNFMQRQRSSYEGPGTTSADIEGSSHRYGIFASDEIELTRTLRTVLGARLDRTLSGGHAATPRFALLWDVTPGLVAKLLDGRAYREPNAYESQYEDIIAQANPGLRNETLRATELALDWRALPNLRLAASAYRYKVANLIEQQEDPATELLVFRNAGTVRARGVELEADYIDPGGWRARASWAGQRARAGGAQDNLSNSPRSLTKVHASVPITPYQARLGVEWQRVGERLTLDAVRLAPYSVTNLTLQFAPSTSKLAFSASLYNAFGKSYSDPGGADLDPLDAVAQDGRQWRLQLTLQF